MKIFISLLLISTLAISAQIDEFASTNNYSRDYNSAAKIAKKHNKLIMLVVVSDYCPWCKKFEKKTLSSDLVKNKVQKNLIPIIINKNKDKEKYPAKFYSKLVPTVIFINPKTSKRVYESLGYMKKSDFIQEIDIALKKFNKMKNNV
ncbi:thioredoxin family protein [Sulfurimonas sp.]|uniref:thioredoxin family protein n=1 Tax=Sulfurimonas sp. TaxID=2022749 RepID=UPI002B47BE64|nr:thioredoxin family protein [Sulfurimonas sp.]